MTFVKKCEFCAPLSKYVSLFYLVQPWLYWSDQWNCAKFSDWAGLVDNSSLSMAITSLQSCTGKLKGPFWKVPSETCLPQNLWCQAQVQRPQEPKVHEPKARHFPHRQPTPPSTWRDSIWHICPVSDSWCCSSCSSRTHASKCSWRCEVSTSESMSCFQKGSFLFICVMSSLHFHLRRLPESLVWLYIHLLVNRVRIAYS